MNIKMFRNLLSVIVIPGMAIALQSCSQKFESGQQGFTLTTITALSESDKSETKTAIDKDLKTLWLTGDAINVFFGNSLSSKFVCQEAGYTAQFKGSIDVVTGGGEGLDDNTYLCGVYPYRADTCCDGSVITLTLPSQQEAKADTGADDLFPVVARSSNFYMSFYHICGCFRFTVSNPDIVKVTLSGNNDEDIAGRAVVSMENKTPKVESVIAGSKELTMNAPEGECFEVGKDYYFALFPNNFEKGVTLTYYKQGQKATYVHGSINLPRKAFIRFRDKDAGLTFENIPLNGWGEGENIGGEI